MKRDIENKILHYALSRNEKFYSEDEGRTGKFQKTKYFSNGSVYYIIQRAIRS